MHAIKYHICYVILRKKDLKDVRITKARIDSECWTDHRLVFSKMNMRLRPNFRKQKKAIRTSLRIGNLQNPHTSELLLIKIQEEVDVHYQNEVTYVETAWAQIKNTIKTASEEILGSEQGRKQEDWFRKNEAVIKEILERKQNVLQAILRPQ